MVNSCWHFGASPIHKQEKQVFWFIRGIAMLSRFTTPSKRVSKILHSLQNERPYGAGTNLKVGEGHTSGAKRRKKIFGVVPLHFFGSTSTISRFCERFRDGQYSLVSFLLAVLLLTVPPVPYGVRATVAIKATQSVAIVSKVYLY